MVHGIKKVTPWGAEKQRDHPGAEGGVIRPLSDGPDLLVLGLGLTRNIVIV